MFKTLKYWSVNEKQEQRGVGPPQPDLQHKVQI